MKIYCLILFLLFGNILSSQTTFIDSTYDLGAGAEYARAIFKDSDNYVVFGSTLGENGLFKFGMLKIDGQGNEISQNTIPDSDFSRTGTFNNSNIIRDSTGGYMIACTSDSLSYYKGTLIRLDPNGDTLFTRNLNENSNGWIFNGIVENSDNTYTITGCEYINPSYSRQLIVKTDSVGNILWIRKYGSSSEIRNAKYICHATNGYICAGYKTTGATFLGYIYKADLNGNYVWTFNTGILNSGLIDVQKLNDGNYLAVGYNAIFSNGSEMFNKCFAIKFSESGVIIWQKEYANPSPTTMFLRALELEDNSLLFIGHQGVSTNPYFWDAIILKANNNGDSLWTRTFDRCGVNSGEMFNDISIKDNGNILLAGSFFYGCEPDYWIMELDSLGCNAENCSQLSLPKFPNEKVRISPNPTNDLIEINSLEKGTISIYQCNGQLLDSFEMQNNTELFNFEKYGSGIYFLTFRINETLHTKRIIVN